MKVFKQRRLTTNAMQITPEQCSHIGYLMTIGYGRTESLNQIKELLQLLNRDAAELITKAASVTADMSIENMSLSDSEIQVSTPPVSYLSARILILHPRRTSLVRPSDVRVTTLTAYPLGRREKALRPMATLQGKDAVLYTLLRAVKRRTMTC